MQDPELAKVLLGDDMDALQETLKMVRKMEEQRAKEYGERGIDCQRASARCVIAAQQGWCARAVPPGTTD